MKTFLLMLIGLGICCVLHANEAPAHSMPMMSDAELEAVTDHDHSKDDPEEHSPHAHVDRESLLNNIRLKPDQLPVTTPQPILPSFSTNKP